jgi:hypothetical protein
VEKTGLENLNLLCVIASPVVCMPVKFQTGSKTSSEGAFGYIGEGAWLRSRNLPPKVTMASQI